MTVRTKGGRTLELDEEMKVDYGIMSKTMLANTSLIQIKELKKYLADSYLKHNKTIAPLNVLNRNEILKLKNVVTLIIAIHKFQ